MKVVINSCYGGFSLSDAAVERCLELGMTLTEYDERGFPINLEADFVRAIRSNGNYHITRSDDNAFRSDPRVVRVVEEMDRRANGPYANLRVMEVPFEGAEGWEIDEDDGFESVIF